MKKQNFSISLVILLLGCISTVNAQYKWENPANQKYSVVRGQAFQEELKGTYVRLPQRAKEKVRQAVWDLSRQSAGLSIAFRSNAPEIKVRYVVNGSFSMPHMPATGVTGLDMYATDANGRSRWCKGNYAFGDTITYTYSSISYEADSGQGYEYQLFLPLYNTVTWMNIGIPADKTLTFLPVSLEQPIVIYGTSIAQGACASRPGMAWGNIVNRVLEHPVINLGFSGNGKLEPELFALLSEINAKLYIVDCMPNLAGVEASKVIYDRTLAGVKQLRAKRQAPILLVEHSGYTNEFSSKSAKESYQVANTELRKAYDTLVKEGISNLYYMTKEECGLSMDGMVEGVHPSDLGMQQYADGYIRKIKEILHEDHSALTTCTPCKQQRDSYNWNDRHEEQLKLNQEGNAPEILMIGNSITHFWGGEPTARIQTGLDSWEELFKGKKVRNLGFGWDRTENVLWRIYHGEMDGYQAKKIFMMLGTNNLQANSDEEIIKGISEITDAIHQRQPQAKLYILAIYPRKDLEDRVKQFNPKLERAMKEKKITYINLAPQLTDKNGKIDVSLFSDGLHPNKIGYQKIAKALKKYL